MYIDIYLGIPEYEYLSEYIYKLIFAEFFGNVAPTGDCPGLKISVIEILKFHA
ncbi:TPA: hypothetical protein HA338_18145 [Methanosarcina acetivorans]|uniref:Uncharacterized protein n=1 Tax=Methanosarcina acetivorans TaxID=2214 RepID=A0A832W026_9EURY|nr:hypothetical protein [Methanosarcina acetivorans]HIH95837.1 hypothetical protein [Methanosarcina acetivorans]